METNQLLAHISEYISYCEIEKGFSQKTIQNKREFFKRFTKVIGEMPFSVLAVKKYREGQHAKGCASSSLTTELKAIRAFIHYLYSQKHIDSDWSDLVTLPKVSKKALEIVTAEKAWEIIEKGCEKGEHDSWEEKRKLYKDALTFILLSGLRIREIIALKRGDFNLETNVFIVHSKGGDEDTLPIPRQAIEMVKGIVKDREQLFPVKPETVNAILKRGCERAKVRQHVHAHTLRHIFATDLLRNGVSIVIVSRLLRHSDISVTTKFYEHLLIEDLRTALNTGSSLSVKNRTPQEVLDDVSGKVKQAKIDNRFAVEEKRTKNELVIIIKLQT